MEQEILTLSGLSDITPFGEFMISPMHYIYITELVESWDHVYGIITLVCLPGVYSDCFVLGLFM